jgi:hypothetical protein
MKINYWYKFITYECVLCGKSDRYKVRMYNEKPKDIAERYEYNQVTCECFYH